MAKGFKEQHFEDYSIVKGNVKVKLNLKQYGEKLQKAQHDLDGQIMNDMKPYMPYQAGTFKQQTAARSTALQGTGKVCAGAPPMGRFLYTTTIRKTSSILASSSLSIYASLATGKSQRCMLSGAVLSIPATMLR